MLVIFEAVPFGSPRRKRKHRIQAIQSLNRGLLIHEKHSRVLRRYPEWNWNGPNMPDLAVGVGNHPMLFAELNGIDRKRKKFAAPQAAADQKSKHRMVSPAPETVALGLQQQRTALIGSEPVPQSHADAAYAFDAADPGGKFRTEQAGISGLVRHTSDCG